jgi:hypothetical protein
MFSREFVGGACGRESLTFSATKGNHYVQEYAVGIVAFPADHWSNLRAERFQKGVEGASGNMENRETGYS